jgi:hypothetical protein
MIWKSVFLSIVLVSIMTVVGCGNGESVAADETLDAAERIWAEIIPVEGTVTDYGIPLSLRNTQQFIDWYNAINLTSAQRALRDGALNSLFLNVHRLVAANKRSYTGLGYLHLLPADVADVDLSFFRHVKTSL